MIYSLDHVASMPYNMISGILEFQSMWVCVCAFFMSTRQLWALSALTGRDYLKKRSKHREEKEKKAHEKKNYIKFIVMIKNIS